MLNTIISKENKEPSKVTLYHEGKNYTITLYKNGNNPNIYYYFRWNRVSHQGSTGCGDLEVSKIIVPQIFVDTINGLRKKGYRGIIRFEDVVERFMEYKRGQKLSPKTIVDYKLKSDFLSEKYGNNDVRQLCSMKQGLFDDYKEWREKYYKTHKDKIRQTYTKGKKLIQGRRFKSVGVVPLNRECRLLVSILKYGQEHMSLLQGVEIPKYSIVKEKRRDEIFTYSEYRKIEKYWKERNYYFYQIISFVDKTGIRYPNELNRILWKDVNFKGGYVEIRDRKSKGDPVNTLIPLEYKTRRILEELFRRDGVPKGSEDLVFVNERGKQIKNITRSFKKCLSDLGIEKKLSMYNFRHTYTTRQVKKHEIPLTMLSYFLGHKDTTMVQRIYSHVKGLDYIKTFHRMEEEKKQQKLKK